uniref:SAM_MT_ERG6_SMT domain-containing protein n=1 Tax=Rhabditophanes sp. KR3021 TaxID=114890 RepID=A0AC35TYV5_9BILA
MSSAVSEVRAAAAEFVTFLNKSVTPFHAVSECKVLLEAAGFKELKETEAWKLANFGKYYVTKNRSAIMAFAIGGNYKPGNVY